SGPEVANTREPRAMKCIDGTRRVGLTRRARTVITLCRRTVMLTVFDTGESSFRLANRHDEDVGWIRGNAVGFSGLPDESAAMKAALAGADTLAAYLERTGGPGSAPERSRGRVKIVQDGAVEWVNRGPQSLARLLRPTDDRPGAFA